MKITIISDSHDNTTRIDQMLDVLEQENIKTMIHCGDVSTQDTLKYLSKNFSGIIYLSLGNVDEMHNLKKQNVNLENVIIFDNFGELNFENIKIAFCHFPEFAKKLANTKKYDFVFYGHTHEPWEENINNTKLINPGTLSGMFNKSTFAILDNKTKNLELKIL